MIFEVADLAVASPATVSRCGMVYLEPHQLGWRPLATSWLATLPAHIPVAYKVKLQGLMDWLVPVSLRCASHDDGQGRVCQVAHQGRFSPTQYTYMPS